MQGFGNSLVGSVGAGSALAYQPIIHNYAGAAIYSNSNNTNTTTITTSMDDNALIHTKLDSLDDKVSDNNALLVEMSSTKKQSLVQTQRHEVYTREDTPGTPKFSTRRPDPPSG
jgi:hypothetical protein